MLNGDVKRKINSLRDILVGKVPDPKAQVEQITIALIYKFMDDMDLEGMEFGGSREFFQGEYDKYAWTNIMQPENSGQQRSNLYAEGIEKMSNNPFLPQLFRDIFRGTYIPYRDPETLNMFLKEINDIKYDNSEKLGNAFEYLLSIMGSQGDAGQFRTPRHIIDMMVEIIDPKKTDSILDPACGTAGFLISAYNHILKNNKDKDGNSTLSADDRKRMTENFAGYDISPDMVRLSRVNMYLHKFTKPQISEYDTLTSLEKWDESYDVIMANPPFMTPKGGIIPHNRYRVKAKRAEVLFVDYIAEHLNPTGKAGIIVPEGIVFQSANAYKSLRKYLIEDDLLYAVISLPAGVFNPYSGVKTSILLLDKTFAKQKDEILFVKINNDGFDLGAQRREVKGSDIPEVIRIVKGYMNGEDVSDNSLVTIVSKKDLAQQDYILASERYKEAVVVNSDYPLVELGEICDFQTGSRQKGGALESGIPSIGGEQINIDGKIGSERMRYISEEHYNSMNKGILKKDDILIVKDGATTGKTGFYDGSFEKAAINEHVFLLRTKENVLPFYLYNIVRSEKFYTILQRYIKGIIGGISLEVKEIKIPIPPLHIQEEIVKEIEEYQKIIDGARQVVENYKPNIKIDPSWEVATIDDICELITDGTHQTPIYSEDGFIFLSSKNVTSRKIDWDNVKYIPQELHEKLYSRLSPRRNDILLAKNGTTGVAAIVDRDCIFDIYVSLALLRPAEKVLPYYLLYFINSDYAKKQFDARLNGIGVPNLHLREIKEVKIPLPSIEKQQKIVQKINEEIAIVDQNKRLIEIFEQKIQDKISEVWGE